MALRRDRASVKAREIPPQVLGRIKGSIAYICPKCKKISQWTHVNWRRARRECTECGKKLEFGIGLNEAVDKLPPFNARLASKVAKDYYNNRLNYTDGQEWIGEITGVIDFFCPKCLERQQRAPTQPECWVKCIRCEAMWLVNLILWHPLPGGVPQMPDDWAMPGLLRANRASARAAERAAQAAATENEHRG
jgi:hypothetical protein